MTFFQKDTSVATKVVVKQDPEALVPTEVIADSIKMIAAGLHVMRSGRLNEKAVRLLIQHACPYDRGKQISATTVKVVLDGIASLEATYLKPRTPSLPIRKPRRGT